MASSLKSGTVQSVVDVFSKTTASDWLSEDLCEVYTYSPGTGREGPSHPALRLDAIKGTRIQSGRWKGGALGILFYYGKMGQRVGMSVCGMINT